MNNIIYNGGLHRTDILILLPNKINLGLSEFFISGVSFRHISYKVVSQLKTFNLIRQVLPSCSSSNLPVEGDIVSQNVLKSKVVLNC